MDRRKTVRYRLEAFVTFSWDDEEGHCLQREVQSRDVSANGTFILSSSAPPVGTSVKLDVCLPRIGVAAPVRLEGEGHVLRVEYSPSGDGQTGFAVVGPGFILSGHSSDE
ncbi:MAG TPA: hypothetical protein VOA64_11000 [Candidatus Dormibacteraeota bacterium]|nr:hypothetical protein [Candidatus Dormibacteraeota bacterium]